MSSSEKQPENFLDELEEYLEQGPTSDNQQLKDLAAQLKNNTVPAEQILQSLGTAVGRESTIHQLYLHRDMGRR
jgi:hypothetical protein